MVTAAQRAASKRNATRRLQLRQGRTGVLARQPRPTIVVPAANLRSKLRLDAGFLQTIGDRGVDLIKSPDGSYDAYFADRAAGKALVLQSPTGTVSPTREMAEALAGDIRQIQGVGPDAATPETVVMRVAQADVESARVAMQHLVDTLNASADPADVRPPLVAVEGVPDQTDPAAVGLMFTLHRPPPAGQGAPPNAGQPNAGAQAGPAQGQRLARDPADLTTDVPLVELMTSEQFAAATQLRGRRTPEYTRLARSLETYHQSVASFRREADALGQQALQSGVQREAAVQTLESAEQRFKEASDERDDAIAAQFDTLIRVAELSELLRAAERGGDEAEIARLRAERDEALDESNDQHARLNSEADDGLSLATINRFQQAIMLRRTELATSETDLNTTIGRLHDRMREYQSVLDLAGRHVLADAQSYVDSKTLSATNERQQAAREVIRQLGDPDQHMQRLKAVVSDLSRVEFRHGLARATEKLNAVSSSDVFRVTTNGPIGDSTTRTGFAKRALLPDESGNDATVNLGFGSKAAVVGDPKLIARQVVSSRIDKALGTNVLADEVFSTDTDGRTLGITATANGRPAMRRRGVETHVDPASGQEDTREAVAYGHFDLTKPGVQRGLADLAVVDAITGQWDRNLGNVFIDDQAETVTGIDNDMALSGTGAPHLVLPTALDNLYPGPAVQPPAVRSVVFHAPLIDARTAAAVLEMTDDQLEALILGRSSDPERLGADEFARAKQRLQGVKDQIAELSRRSPSGIIHDWGPVTFGRALVEGVSPGAGRQNEHSYLTKLHRAYTRAGTAADPWSTHIP